MTVDHIHWLGHATFRIDDGAAVIYIDPWKLPADAPKADVVLITHAHFDHYSAEDIARVEKPTTVFVAPADVASKLTGKHVVTASPGGSYQAGTVKVTAVAAYNTNKDFHPKANGWVGYLVTLSNGQRIYHTGDSDVTPEMKAVQTDVALMPCGGHLHDDRRGGGCRGQRVRARHPHPDALGRYRRIARRCGRRGEGVRGGNGHPAGRAIGQGLWLTAGRASPASSRPRGSADACGRATGTALSFECPAAAVRRGSGCAPWRGRAGRV